MLDPAAAAVLASSGPPQTLLNGYGPTESTTVTTWHAVQPDDVAEAVPRKSAHRPTDRQHPYLRTRCPPATGPRERPGRRSWLGGDGLALVLIGISIGVLNLTARIRCAPPLFFRPIH